MIFTIESCLATKEEKEVGFNPLIQVNDFYWKNNTAKTVFEFQRVLIP